MLEALKQHIQEVINLSDLLELTDTVKLQQAGVQKLQARLERKQEEIDRYQTLLRSLYENLTDGIIDREEYRDFKKNYTKRREEAEEQADAIREEMNQEMVNFSEGRGWMEQFRRHRNIDALDRSIVVSLIERSHAFQSCNSKLTAFTFALYNVGAVAKTGENSEGAMDNQIYNQIVN